MIIEQSRTEFGKYEVILAAGSGKIKLMFRIFDTKEREKLELFLIVHPDVHYLEGPTDGLIIHFYEKYGREMGSISFLYSVCQGVRIRKKWGVEAVQGCV